LPNSLIVEILGNGKQFAQSIDEASNKTARLGKAAKIAGTAILGGLAYGLDKSVEAAVKAQTSTARMDQAFKQSGLSAKTFAGQIDHAEQSARNLGFANSDVRESLGSLVIATKSGKESFKDLGIAEDLARFKHIGLTDSTKMLTTAMAGSTKAVHALGLNIIPVTSAVDRVNQEFKVHTGRAYEAAKATAELADKQATAKEIIAAVTDKVHGQAQAFAETAAGKMQTFKAQLESIGESIGQVVLPALESFASVLAKVAGWLAQHQTVAKILVAGLAALGVTLVAIIPLVTAFGTALAFVAANPIVLLVAGIALLAGAIAAAVLAPQKFEAALEKMGVSAGTAKAIVTDLQGVFTDFKAVVEALLPTIEAIFEGIVEEIKGAFTVIKGIFDVIDGLLHGNWSQVWTGLKDIVSGSLQAIEGLLQAATAVLGSIMTAILGAMWSAVQSGWQTIENFFGGIGGDITSAIGDLGSLLATAGTDVISGLYNAAVTAWNTATSWFKGIPQAILAAIGGVATLLAQKGQDILTGLWNGAKNVWSNVASWVGGIPGKIKDAIGGVAQLLTDKGKAVLNSLWDGAKDVWNTVKSWFGDLGSKARTAVGDVGRLLYDKGKQVLTGLWDGAKNVWATVTGWFRDLGGKIKDALGDLSRLLYSSGIALLKGLESGIVSEAKHLYSVVSGIAGKIAGFFPHSPAKEGPLSVPINWGAYLTDGLSQGGEVLYSGMAAILGTPLANIMSAALSSTIVGVIQAAAAGIPDLVTATLGQQAAGAPHGTLNPTPPPTKTTGGTGLIPHMAVGGIVRTPTLALIGEKGPEAVVPLNQMNGGPPVYNFNFPNYVGSKQELTNMIQQQLLRLQLRGGQALLPG